MGGGGERGRICSEFMVKCPPGRRKFAAIPDLLLIRGGTLAPINSQWGQFLCIVGISGQGFELFDGWKLMAGN